MNHDDALDFDGITLARRAGPIEAIDIDAARADFRAQFGAEAEAVRAAAIVALDSLEWRGCRYYRITCDGPPGRGAHPLNVTEAFLWRVIDLDHVICPWH
jgi:hypothetical protein